MFTLCAMGMCSDVRLCLSLCGVYLWPYNTTGTKNINLVFNNYQY